MIIFMNKRWKLSLFLIALSLFGWSLFMRFYQLGNIPVGLYWDEAAILVDARSIASSGFDMHGRPWYQVIYPSYGDYKLPVYIWLAGLSVKVFGPTALAIRLPSALAGISTVIVSGLIIKLLIEEFGNREQVRKSKISLSNLVGVLTSTVVAISPWSILFSRTGFEAHLGQFLLSLSILFALLSRKKRSLILLAPVFGILATYSYFSVRFVWLGVFTLLVSLMYILPELKPRMRKVTPVFSNILIFLFLPIILFSLGLLPMFHSPLYEASNTFRLSTDSVLNNFSDVMQSNIYRQEAGNTKVDRLVFYRWWLTGKKLMANYADNVSLQFLFLKGDPNLRHGTGQHGLFLLIFLPFFAIGWYVLFKKNWQIFFLFLSWWMFALLPASVPNTTPHALRSLNALVPLAGVIGVGLAYSTEALVAYSKKVILTVSVIFFTVLFFSLIHFSNYYFTEYPVTSVQDWQGGFEDVTKSIFKLRDAREDVYVLPFDDRFYLWILGYGPYTSQQIQLFPQSGFQIRDFDFIYTEHIPATTANEAIVVGPEMDVAAFVVKEKYSVVLSEIINKPNQKVFEVAKVKRELK